MNEIELAKARWSRILPFGYIGQQSFFTTRDLLRGLPRSMDFSSLLDLGCGRGKFAVFLAQRSPCLSVTGIDINDEDLEIARGCARDRGLGARAMFIKADFDNKNVLSRAKWDCIISIDALQHSKNLVDIVLRIREAWSQKGPLLFSLWVFSGSFRARKLAAKWGITRIWRTSDITALADNLSVGMSVQVNAGAFARRVERSLSSLVHYEGELQRLVGARSYEQRFELEKATCAAVAAGDLTQVFMYAARPATNNGME